MTSIVSSKSQNLVRLLAGGFGYFLSVSLYFATSSSMGLATHPNSAPGVAHIRRSLIAHLPGGFVLRSIIRGEDDKRVVVNAELLQRVEDLADVVIAFHQLVTVLTNLRPARELL
jgi:hypothetical protein